MISLILPYWNRQEAADKALTLLWQTYADMFKSGDLEVVLVDDGSVPAFVWPTSAGFINMRMIKLPAKREAKCPATAWNAGVAAARGEYVALSCVEILHDRGPVLAAMRDELKRSGPKAYVLAAAWCPEQGAWHTHSTVSVPECPKGAGIAFLGMMRKELFERAGGFDEDYREGAGYEDRDFIWRMASVGARFIHRDDLAVTHPKTGASIAWGDGKFDRNQALFTKKWIHGKRKVTIACVQAQNYCGRGAEYVNKLYDMVQRSMPRGVIFRFVCLTDDAKGLDEGIETLELPSDLEGWYGKLYLFKRGLFADGERVIFLDLDTVIIGGIDDLVNYEGDFATLRDFYTPTRVGPAVICWRAGEKNSAIWEQWVETCRPRLALGDLEWINSLDEGRFAERADKLQALFPGMFASYKRDCDTLPPSGTRIVCFHGLPRPHEVADEWVTRAWAIGGTVVADFPTKPNTERELVAVNVRSSSARDLPWLALAKPRAGDALIVGGGPSLIEMLDELRLKSRTGGVIYAVNGAFRFLDSRGITPDWHVIIDARKENADFITGTPKQGYLLASQCAPETFDKAGKIATVVHMNTADILEAIPQSIKPLVLISSGTTVGLAALALSYAMGYRQQYLYGMDSSYESEHHAYPQKLNDADQVVEATAGGRTFKCAPWMISQVQNFQKLVMEMANDGCEVNVRSRGMLGHVAWLMQQQQEAADAAA